MKYQLLNIGKHLCVIMFGERPNKLSLLNLHVFVKNFAIQKLSAHCLISAIFLTKHSCKKYYE